MTSHRTETIVISSCITPSSVQYLSIAAPIERLRQTTAGLLHWFEHRKVRTVVICDNSGFRFDFAPLVQRAASRGVEFESIAFEDEGIAERLGKGAGEGQILDRALSQSRLLDGVGSFWKCTGKLGVANFNEVAEAHSEDAVVFKRPGWTNRSPFNPASLGVCRASMRWMRSRLGCAARRLLHGFDPDTNVNTQFWKCDRSFFDRVLRRSYLTVQDRRRYFIEHAYANAMRNEAAASFTVEPQIVGKGGSIQVTYGGGLPAELLGEVDQWISDGFGR